MYDSSPLGPDARPELDLDSGPISRESYADQGELGPNAVLKRIGSKGRT